MKKYTYKEVYEGANLHRKGLGDRKAQSITFKWDGDKIVAKWFRGNIVFREVETSDLYVTGEYEDSEWEVFIVLNKEDHNDLTETYNKEFEKLAIKDTKFSYDDEKFIWLDNGKTIKHIDTGTILK